MLTKDQEGLTQDYMKGLVSYFIEHQDKGKTQTDFL